MKKNKIIITYDEKEITNDKLFMYVARINEMCIDELHTNWVIEKKGDKTKAHIHTRTTKTLVRIFDVKIK